ncbi:Aste57867_4671 [Aphanomyces stellatus]|uniref:Aste57867_4671 protein n=1 Tax=Aphanomyces stellatus TaxID=120398 RepID=A0A485KFS5_9STRA|nr:hypothetical protein As57867_004658 [Aphanomyces stellatus]VFT81774.1 Aste57867_4671 [Aphanomyces stellatus]
MTDSRVRVIDGDAYRLLYGRLTDQHGRPYTRIPVEVEPMGDDTTTAPAAGLADDDGYFQILIPRTRGAVRISANGHGGVCRPPASPDSTLWECSLEILDETRHRFATKSSPFLFWSSLLLALASSVFLWKRRTRQLPHRPRPATRATFPNTPAALASLPPPTDIAYMITTPRRIHVAPSFTAYHANVQY